MNTDILNCQKYLKPENPVEVTSTDVIPYLKQLGWNDGDKIPDGMQEYTAAVLRILGKPVSIRSLPIFFEDETVKATLRSAINKTNMFIVDQNNIKDRVKELVPDIDHIKPEMSDTLIELATKAVQKDIENEAKSSIIEEQDDYDGFSEVAINEEKTIEEDSYVKEESFEELVDAQKNIYLKDSDEHRLCPRCMWDISEPYVPYPVTDDDKLMYAYSVLGGTDFIKSYRTGGGLLEITYKTPSAKLTRMVEDQVKLDSTHGRIQDYEQTFININRYSLAISIDSVKALKGVDINPPIPKWDEDRFKLPLNTNLYLFTEYIEENIIKNSIRERFFRDTYSEFMQLQIHLSRTIDTENFFAAVLDKLS